MCTSTTHSIPSTEPCHNLTIDSALLSASADGVSEADRLLEVVPGQGIRLSLSLSSAAAKDVATALSLPTTPPTPRSSSPRSFASTSSEGLDQEIHATTVMTVLVGSPSLMGEGQVALSEEAVRVSESLRTGGKVVVYLAVNGHLRAVIGVTDSIR